MEKLIGHNGTELFEATIQTLNKIKEAVRTNSKYEIKGEINSLFNLSISKINDLGICDRKRLKRAINRANLKASLFSYNRFLWFVNKIILNNSEAVKVTEPKHESIQQYKKKWKEAQKLADEWNEEYKAQKGNYYKK